MVARLEPESSQVGLRVARLVDRIYARSNTRPCLSRGVSSCSGRRRVRVGHAYVQRDGGACRIGDDPQPLERWPAAVGAGLDAEELAACRTELLPICPDGTGDGDAPPAGELAEESRGEMRVVRHARSSVRAPMHVGRTSENLTSRTPMGKPWTQRGSTQCTDAAALSHEAVTTARLPNEPKRSCGSAPSNVNTLLRVTSAASLSRQHVASFEANCV